MMPIIDMKEEHNTHRYYVTGDHRISPKTPLPSVSTIARLADSRGATGLIKWAIRLYTETGNPDEHERSTNNSLRIGFQLHSDIQEYISTGEAPRGASPLFGVWQSKLGELGIQWQGTEEKIYNLKEGIQPYGGTVDAIGVLDGTTVLFDWKTTNQYRLVKDHDTGAMNRVKNDLNSHAYAVQIAGYRSALLDMSCEYYPDFDVPTEAYIVYIFKDTQDIGWKKVDLKKATEAFFAANSLYAATHTKGGLYDNQLPKI